MTRGPLACQRERVSVVPINIRDPWELEPGTYFLELEAPARVLDAMAQNPDAAATVMRFVVAQSGAPIEFMGGGPTWSTSSGTLKRVYSMRLEVPEGAPPVMMAGVDPVRVALALAAVLGAAGVTLWAVNLYRLEPDRVGDAIEDANANARTFLWLAGAAGAYWVARRQGWIA